LATFAFSGREKFETKKKILFFFKGSYIGTLITMMFGGIIAAYWSWEWIFYLSGKIYFCIENFEKYNLKFF